MNKQEIEQLSEEKIAKFVKDLDGRFKEFVSDKFIKAYLKRQFMIEWIERPGSDLGGIAYHASVVLFEHHLEAGCKAICNGHHVAQDFSTYFPKDK